MYELEKDDKGDLTPQIDAQMQDRINRPNLPGPSLKSIQSAAKLNALVSSRGSILIKASK